MICVWMASTATGGTGAAWRATATYVEIIQEKRPAQWTDRLPWLLLWTKLPTVFRLQVVGHSL